MFFAGWAEVAAEGWFFFALFLRKAHPRQFGLALVQRYRPGLAALTSAQNATNCHHEGLTIAVGVRIVLFDHGAQGSSKSITPDPGYGGNPDVLLELCR
jgi:hypothetical protein